MKGVRVIHVPPPEAESFGIGEIIDEWSDWHRCRDCNGATSSPNLLLCEGCGEYTRAKVIPPDPDQNIFITLYVCRLCGKKTDCQPTFAICENCGGPREVRRVSGKRIYVVRFQTVTKDVHEDWLKPCPKAP